MVCLDIFYVDWHEILNNTLKYDTSIILLFYNSSIVKKLISSNLHFKHKIVGYSVFFCSADDNRSEQSHSSCNHSSGVLE